MGTVGRVVIRLKDASFALVCAVLIARQNSCLAVEMEPATHAAPNRTSSLDDVAPPPAEALPVPRSSEHSQVSLTAPSGSTSAPAHPQVADLGPVFKAVDSFLPDGWDWGATQVQSLSSGSVDPAASDQLIALLKEYRALFGVSRVYQRGQRRVVIKLYRFESPQGAYGAYTLLREGATTVIPRGDLSSEDDQCISFWQGNFFVSITTTAEDDDEAKGMMSELAQKVTAQLEGHARVPAIIADLPHLDRLAGSEKLVMGPVGARRVISVPFTTSLSLDQTKTVVSADYLFRVPTPERLKLLLLEFASAESAAQAYRKYCLDLQAEHDSTGGETTAMFKLQRSYLLCQLRGSILVVIAGARRRVSPMFLSRQLDLIVPVAEAAHPDPK